MRQRPSRLTAALLLGLALAQTGCAASATMRDPAGTSSGTIKVGVPTAEPASPSPSLPLTTAIGQVTIASTGGTVIDAGLRHLILDDKVGAVLLFASNFGDAAGLARWTRDLRALGRQAALPAPLLVMVDEEGGSVMQVRDGVAPLPSALVLGRHGPAVVRRSMAATASGLRSLGVGLDLAPDADLRTNPADAVIGDRAFGSDPAAVGPLVAAAVTGLHDGGVGATLKHFPGLGGAAGNPHLAVPTDSIAAAAWRAGPKRSFAAGIAAGADCIMVTAVRVPSLDSSGAPAMFSAPIVRLLRRELGFGGVIVTDSVSMGGVQAIHQVPESAVLALSAGVDWVMLGNDDPAFEDRAVVAMRTAVTDGRVSAAQVQASAQRVIALRQRWTVGG
ncbi:MAG TPA: glycoside hydrolase family 3 N-terminal domain-containing protein [Candidatus Dormibacteraeota bacterium]|jgi:beta-N-acetylhexosaminidase|nr:glycoside hydrolase family 3 N-terminal domain-containing protein [Candidatus Dormibacteraeota bacterium]